MVVSAMDPSTLALSSALADLCIYNVTDLVALARAEVVCCTR